MTSASYGELLRDPRWQRKRLEILQRSDFKCEECDSGERTLNVHHLKYRKGAKPWEYDDHELRALCEPCHHFEHRIRGELANLIAAIDTEMASEVLGFVQGLVAQQRESETGEPEFDLLNYSQASGYASAHWPTGAMTVEKLITDAQENGHRLSASQMYLVRTLFVAQCK